MMDLSIKIYKNNNVITRGKTRNYTGSGKNMNSGYVGMFEKLKSINRKVHKGTAKCAKHTL